MFTYFVTAVRTIRKVYIYKALVNGLSALTTEKIQDVLHAPPDHAI